MDIGAAKRAAASEAAAMVESGDVVGLGSGSTAARVIDQLGRRVDEGLDIVGIPTSYQSRERALEAGIALVEPDQVESIDIAIDGADQVERDPSGGHLIKGGGGAHVREKLIDAAADEFVVVLDTRKLASVLDEAVPVAVVPTAKPIVAAEIRELGGDPTLRAAEHKSGPVVTDDGHLILDCDFGDLNAPADLAQKLAVLPGVVDHGLFVGLADRLVVGSADGATIESL